MISRPRGSNCGRFLILYLNMSERSAVASAELVPFMTKEEGVLCTLYACIRIYAEVVIETPLVAL